MKVLAYIKFPRKHTLSQRLTCKKFIREASLDHPRLESCGAERKISWTVLQSQQRPQMTPLGALKPRCDPSELSCSRVKEPGGH